MPDLSQIDWVSVIVALVVLAVVWTIVQRVLKLTMQLFACGCVVLAGVALAGAFLIYVAPQWR